jgi:peptide methionine sulfoxide reductase msrA/msrB
MKNLFISFAIFAQLFSISCAQPPKKTVQNSKNTSDSFIQLTDEEWKAKLKPEQYYVLRENGTEKPYSGEFVFTKEKGIYSCAGCGQQLFSDEMKFDAHCGWPSFDREIAGGKIVQTEDNSHGMKRTSISCSRCGGHLGHIFDDGPTETRNRYCVNSVSLNFEPKSTSPKTEKITLGGGCFWCIEAFYEELKGVEKVESGYSGGTTENPSYNKVCEGKTGHAEVVQITYNPEIISLTTLLEVFFKLHDPTSKDKQGADEGTQYRSVIFYHNEEQHKIIDNTLKTLNDNKAFEIPIVTEVTAYKKFYIAENYHQEYYQINKEEPYCKAVIKPKMDKLEQIFAQKLKKNGK